MGTLHPLSENYDRYVFKKELIGNWIDPEDSTVRYYIDTLPHYGGKLYGITILDTSGDVPDTTLLSAYIINLNGSYFIDSWQNIPKDNRVYVVPRHFIMQLSFIDRDNIGFVYPNPEKLIKLIDRQKIQLKYSKVAVTSKDEDYEYLILDKPAVLQKALIEVMRYPDMYKIKFNIVRLQ